MSLTERIKKRDNAIELAKEILNLIDDLPEAATDFAIGIEETASGILSSIEDNKRVSDKQIDALENMRNGISGWLDKN